MRRNRLGQAAVPPAMAAGWAFDILVPSAALIGANGMRWGSDGELYVAQAFGSQLSAVDVDTGATRIVSAADGEIMAPDDLAFDSRGNLFITEVMSARVSVIRPNGTIGVVAGDLPVANGISIHGDRIFMSEFNPAGRIWELYDDGSAPRLIASDLMMPNALCLGPDGMLYFPLVPLGEIWRVSVDGGTPERVIGDLDIPTAVKFDANGRLFVVESGSGAVSRVDPATGTRSVFARVAYGIDNFAFAPDGRMFVSHFTDGQVVEILPDGVQRIVVSGGMTGPFGIAAGHGGELLVADGMSLAVVERAGALKRPAMLLQHGFPGYVRGVAAGDDGSFIVTNSAGQCARYRAGGEADILCDGLDCAMGVAVAKNGDVLICEYGAGRVLLARTDGQVLTLASGLDGPAGIAQAPDGGFYVSEAKGGKISHVKDDGVRPVLSGLQEPHGVTVTGGSAFILDRGSASVHRLGPDGKAVVIAENLPVGTREGLRPNILPGIADLMPGPLLPFSDITALEDGRVVVGGDTDGSLLAIRANG